MKLEFSWQIFEKYSNIKFHENPSHEMSCSMQADMMKLTVAFCNFADVPKMYVINWFIYPFIFSKKENPKEWQ